MTPIKESVAKNIVRSILHQAALHRSYPVTLIALDAQRAPLASREVPSADKDGRQERMCVAWLVRIKMVEFVRICPTSSEGLHEWLKSVRAYSVPDSKTIRSGNGWKLKVKTALA